MKFDNQKKLALVIQLRYFDLATMSSSTHASSENETEYYYFKTNKYFIRLKRIILSPLIALGVNKTIDSEGFFNIIQSLI